MRKKTAVYIFALGLFLALGDRCIAAKRLSGFELKALADLVVKGEVVSVAKKPGANGLAFLARVKVIEVIKGEAQADIAVNFIMKETDDSVVLVDECRQVSIAEKDKGIFYLKKEGRREYAFVTPCEESFEREKR